MANNIPDGYDEEVTTYGTVKLVKKEKPFMRWVLPQLPNGSDVARLVEQKVITPEEARQICFNEEKGGANSRLPKNVQEAITSLNKRGAVINTETVENEIAGHEVLSSD